MPLPATPLPVSDFSGIWVPLVTPFRHGAVDHGALATLVRVLAPTGIAGFVVCGSTGEAAALDDAEQLAVLATVAQTAPALPRIMGVSGYHMDKMLAWVRRLHDSQELAGLLVPAPHYIRPSQAGLLHWFSAIADASTLPLLVYDIPYRTGSTIATDTLLALARHPRIRGIKDCGGDAAKTRTLIADGRLQVLAGEDAALFATVAEGGVGAIAASAHLHTERFMHLLRALQAGRLDEARTLWRPLLSLMEALFCEANPAPLKAALAQDARLAGALCDELRAPMCRASDAARARVAQALAAFTPP